MAKTDTTVGQILRQPGGAEEDSRFRKGDRQLRLAYDDDEDCYYFYSCCVVLMIKVTVSSLCNFGLTWTID